MKRIMVIVIWVSLVVIIALAVFKGEATIQSYHSQRFPFEGIVHEHGVDFKINSDWLLDIKSSGPVRMVAADSSYFQLTNDFDSLYPIPEDPPFGYSSGPYYRLVKELWGVWEVEDGHEISVALIGKAPFSVACSPTPERFQEVVSIVVCMGFFFSFLGGLLIWTLAELA